MELGSGSGVVGLCLAAVGHNVVLTDRPLVTLPSYNMEGEYEGEYNWY